MLRPHGYATWDGNGRLERDTVTCVHCSAVVFVKPGTGVTVYLLPDGRGQWREEAGAWCRLCHGPVCLRCHSHGRCLPLERRLELMERKG
jgi:hypothetical protein